MNNNKIYRYPAHLQISFPEGLENIDFLEEIEGFNYLSIRRKKGCTITLPNEFKKTKLPKSFLEKIRKKYYNQSEDLRKKYQFQNLFYKNIELSASQMARSNIMTIISIEDDLENIHYWKDVKEKEYKFTINDFKEILKIISNRDSKLYHAEAEIKKEIKLKINQSSLQPFDLDCSWQKYANSIYKIK